ncbi:MULTISPECIES: glycosyltransferase family 4 protein [unclassified Modestobacter]|uniref:glycosyltransferase family 4 protein n=1 Tax=unclassified Modestobacter TaxID=2643866 RepID=UPI0022A9FABF|nr:MULTISPECIES: glycosyltransferase family 1 protein [unclassified Modestobacter]MCZ2823786.1 glycosyltransferase family 1 protein [Modestobacter sp. VKM Ac-2981]MCZ2852031.1 glycosyltransferase family 1 protein [Modestobacter sp. VKM Ac-2982]
MTVEQCWQQVPGGSGTYIRELLREYAGRADVAVSGVSALHRHGARPPLGPEVPVRAVPLPRAALYETWSRWRVPRAGGPDDVVHATTWAVPGSRRPLVVTVHDLAFLHDPEHFTPRGVTFFRRGLAIARDEATAVVVPSSVTGADVVEAGFDPERVHVVPHGVRPATTVPQDLVAFRERFGLSRPYVLWAGTREPRKNLPTLVSAFEQLLAGGADLDLVLVGPDGWGSERSRLTGSTAGRVRLLGRVSDHDLQTAYAGALVFCYPSLREGYGMPVTEAMAHGTPVVTSRDTATEEAAGGAAVLVDPRDVTDVARGLAAAVEPARQPALRAASAHRAAQLSWSNSAQATIDVLRWATERGPRRG